MSLNIDTEGLFFLCIKVWYNEDMLSVTFMRQVSRLNKLGYELFGMKISKYRAIYYKFAPKLARSFRKRSIKYPVIYDSSIVTSQKIQDVLYAQQKGLRLFDLNPIPFRLEWLKDNRVGISDVTLWFYKPIDFFIVLFITDTLAHYQKYSEAQFMPILSDTENPRYVIQLNLPTIYNQILLGSPIVPHQEIYLCITNRLSDSDGRIGFSSNPVFVSRNVERIFVRYDTVPESKYNFNNFCMGICAEGGKNINTHTIVLDYKSYMKVYQGEYDGGESDESDDGGESDGDNNVVNNDTYANDIDNDNYDISDDEIPDDDLD